MNDALRALVRSRSNGYCEYCKMPEVCDRLPFQPDHIIAEKHNGVTEESNLAWSCYDCNLYKGPNIAGIDPQSGAVTPLFDPRRHTWREHFQFSEGVIEGLTPQGRATVATLRINLSRRIALRVDLVAEGVYPPCA